MSLSKTEGGPKNPISAGFSFIKEKSKEIINTINGKANGLELKIQETNTISTGQREEVYSGNALRGFIKPGEPYQLTIAQQRVKLCNQQNKNIECHIVKQSHGAEKLFTIIDTQGNILTTKGFHDYRLVKRGNNIHIIVQYENHGKLEDLIF